MDGARALPYPHARNDCEICRERDADFHRLGEAFNSPATVLIGQPTTSTRRLMNPTGNIRHPGPAGGLLVGCQNYPVAIRKAEEMIQAWRRTGGGEARGRDIEFWDSATAQTLGCYLHAAALSGLPVSSAAGWLAGPACSATAVGILATHPGACRQAAASLRTLLDPRPSKTAETIGCMAAVVFAHSAGHRRG